MKALAKQELDPVVLLPEGVIRGKVVDKSTGKPLNSFRAYYTWSKVKLPGDPRGSMSMASHRGDLFSNAEGQFEFDGFSNGMPLQVTIEAEGYRKCVVDRVMALARDEAKLETFRIEPIDTAKLMTISGRIVDSDNKGISGVEVRLICSDERIERDPAKHAHSRDRDAFPYNWEMIFSNQIAEDSRVLQFLETTTDAKGEFSFSNVQSAKDIEIVCWNDDVVRTRRPHIEGLSETRQQSVTIVATQSGTVRGSIDMRANPYARPRIQVGEVRYGGKILNEGKLFEIRGVPAGEHEVLISGDPKPLKIPGREDDVAFTTSIIKRIPVVVSPGKVSRADAIDDR